MDSPRIILRFRNVNSNIDTMSEHQRVIKEKNHVCWGWWKKDHEPSQAHLFGGEPSSVLIIDTSEKRLYQAEYSESFLTAERVPDLDSVPEYYRDKISKVAGWFLFNHIVEKEYDYEIENIIGQRTLCEKMYAEKKVEVEQYQDCGGVKKNSILHISDLHFGKDHAFKSNEIG
ncbi:MAG: hypothetical protein ACI85O_003021, partial [Saprospiraceae bacterium]